MHKVAKIETKVNRKGLRRTTTGRVGRQASAAYSCRFVAPQHRQTWRHHQTFPGSSPNIFARGNRQPGGNVFFADKWIREPGTGFHCQGGHGSRFRRPLRDLRAASINGVACIRKRATNPHDRPAGGRKATGIQTQPGRSRATSPRRLHSYEKNPKGPFLHLVFSLFVHLFYGSAVCFSQATVTI